MAESLLVVLFDVLGHVGEGLRLVLGQLGLQNVHEGAVGVGLHDLLAHGAADVIARILQGREVHVVHVEGGDHVAGLLDGGLVVETLVAHGAHHEDVVVTLSVVVVGAHEDSGANEGHTWGDALVNASEVAILGQHRVGSVRRSDLLNALHVVVAVSLEVLDHHAINLERVDEHGAVVLPLELDLLVLSLLHDLHVLGGSEDLLSEGSLGSLNLSTFASVDHLLIRWF
jgi:hypothetical protein